MSLSKGAIGEQLQLDLPLELKPRKSSRSSNAGDPATKLPPKAASLQESSSSSVIVFPKPDGRRCDCCPLTDAEEDPVAARLKKAGMLTEEVVAALSKFLRRQSDGLFIVWWGYRQDKVTGASVGNTCGYCMHVYTSRIRARRVPLQVWKGQLGCEPKLLQAHQQLVKVEQEMIYERGGRFRCHLN